MRTQCYMKKTTKLTDPIVGMFIVFNTNSPDYQSTIEDILIYNWLLIWLCIEGRANATIKIRIEHKIIILLFLLLLYYFIIFII